MSTESGIPAVPENLGSLSSRIKEAIEYAKEQNKIVRLDFNGTAIYISPYCTPELVALNWDQIMKARSEGTTQSSLYTEQEHGVLEVVYKPPNS